MINFKQTARSLTFVIAAGALTLVAFQPVVAGHPDRSTRVLPAQATATSTRANTATPRPTATPPARATARATPVPTLPPGITIQPISQVASIRSYKTVVSMRLDGQSTGRVARGDFNAELQTNVSTRRQSIGITGSLISTLLGQYLRGIPISGLTVYLIEGKPYVVAQALIVRVCAVPGAPIAGLDQLSSGLSADVFLIQMTGSNKIYGTLVGNETVNGIPTRRYKLDVKTINELAKKNRASAQLKSGEVWIAVQGDYIVRLNVEGTGNLAANTGVDFNGNAGITLNVSDVNRGADIRLPAQCNNPMRLPG